ncbi:PAAR domain-containing protein [Pseudomonas sp. LD120]|uniref:PAAR domain-containing protein n=1 Tax=Pseudomonas sp. LD120 TaxID=485751 RepID=UPI00135A57D9|nr:PAAR domain-containing protein [Pseudomonas sp. LD120]KAF0864154.1 PAAR domain-containing protein [Pseudomonas sp. LD120]
MSGRGAIRLGDRHSGGGSMIEASGFPVNGIVQCLLGDKALCPTHLGTYVLVSGGDGSAIHNGRPMAFEPATLACGCSVVSSCTVQYAKA